MVENQVRRIAILMGQDLSFCRKAIRGIRAYALRKTDWVFRNGPPDMQIIPHLRDWKPHGIIANLFTSDVARAVLRMRRPVVDTACMLPGLRIPTVDVDHMAVGRLAAEHLIDRKFTCFGFFGSEGAVYSQLRERGFRDELARHGFSVSSCYGEYLHQVPTTIGWKRMDREVGAWLKGLPKPVAIFAANDVPARNLADMCRHLNLQIPNQVALLGVDDDELVCPLAAPPLSSVAIPSERIGYEAARLLDRMMSKEDVPKEPLWLPPLDVITRQSTDTMAIRDATVLAALTFIRHFATQNISVSKVVQEIGCGRRELERRFRALLGRSVLDEIRLVRVKRAEEILSNTDLSMPAVAAQAGFSNAQRFAVVFRQLTGASPTAYRRRSQLHDQG